MKKVSSTELSEILNGKFDFILELYILTEDKICIKPIYKFREAFVCDINIPEFCLIYSEADDPEEIHISLNSKKFERILSEYKIRKIIFHGENGEGELYGSFYRCAGHAQNAKNCRLLTREDKNLCDSFGGNENDYFNIIFNDFIVNKIYRDCGIIAVHDEHSIFTGYLAYYGIAENIRDISYIYVGKKFRGRGYGKNLLNFFADKNTDENKISYYSYADGEISEKLARSCGFLPCAKRTEAYI